MVSAEHAEMKGYHVIKTLSIVSIMVRDLAKALDFYAGKLGFVKIADMPMDEGALGDYRTV